MNPQINTPSGQTATDLQQKKTLFVLIHQVCFLPFYRMRCRFIRTDPFTNNDIAIFSGILFSGEVSSLVIPPLIGLQFGIYPVGLQISKKIRS